MARVRDQSRRALDVDRAQERYALERSQEIRGLEMPLTQVSRPCGRGLEEEGGIEMVEGRLSHVGLRAGIYGEFMEN